MNLRALALLAAVALAAPALTGCLGLFGSTDETTAPELTDEQKLKDLGNKTRQEIEDRFSENPKVYSFPAQQALPARTEYLNGTVNPGENGGLEDKNDRGGNDFAGLEKRFDVSHLVPVGQPTELRVTLFYTSKLGSAADLDILVDVPGARTTVSRESSDEWNWKFTVKTLTINTIGVSGAKHELGVQVQNGRVLMEPLPYSIKVVASYAQNALTPYHAWAFDVPENASGIILESVKAGGPENVEAKFSIIGPDDELLEHREYNDISVPTQSIFIPVKSPGQHIFYAYQMRGGFLSLKSDAPLADRTVKTLALTEELVADKAGLTPGVGDRPPAVNNATKPSAAGGEDVKFAVATFPLELTVFIKNAGNSATLQAQGTITGPKGKVSELLRYVRYDDDRGSLGVSHDAWNSEYHPENLAKGDYTIHIVNDGTAVVGHRIVTYTR